MGKPFHHGSIVLLIAILILVLVFILSGLQFLESTGLFGTRQEPEIPSKTIVRDGVEYFPRQDITVVLFAGIDEFGPAVDSGSYNNPGEADMVSLLIFDETEKKLDILALNRDIMLKIPVLGLGGKPAGSIHAQLALAHTYGSGLDDSGENLRDAVSDFLYGVDIDYYVTMRMDAIALLNDAVGGVKVNVTDDFSQTDPAIPMGQTVLTGQQALNFVRTRYGVGDQLNLGRMQRQEAYMRGFVSALKAGMDSSASFFLDTYDQVSDYLVTDSSAKAMGSLADRYSDYTLGDVVSIKGENVEKEYMEFHVDEKDLDRVVLHYLYAPKK